LAHGVTEVECSNLKIRTINTPQGNHRSIDRLPRPVGT
jgi:hypothetical protein